MTHYLALYYSSMAMILVSMLISGIQLSKGVKRNQSFYLMSFGNLIGFTGAAFIVMAFVVFGNNLGSFQFFEELSDSIFKRVLFFGIFTFGLSMLSQPLYFRALHKKVSIKFILSTFLGIVLFNFTVFIITKSGAYLNRAFAIHIFVVFSLSWLLAELVAINKKFPTPWVNLIRPLVLIAIGAFLVWMIVILIVINQGSIWGFTQSEISQFDISFRFLRGALFLFMQLIILIHWMENFSYNAIKIKKRDEQIQHLLEEKDSLIENLSNTNSLIETGALSAGLAHELNQFLTRIELNSDEVLEQMNRPNVDLEDLKPALRNILSANQSAANIVYNLKKLFQASQDSFSLTNLDNLIEGVVLLYQDRFQKSKIQVHLDLSAKESIMAWDSLMRQVVSNLIINAIDALDTADQPNKCIWIRSYISEEGRIGFSIADNGAGIDAAQANKLFSLFASSKPMGTGIGLWLCGYIVERHRGTLRFENLPDHGGVRFEVALPIDPRGALTA